jgi:hypothetical protein
MAGFCKAPLGTGPLWYAERSHYDCLGPLGRVAARLPHKLLENPNLCGAPDENRRHPHAEKKQRKPGQSLVQAGGDRAWRWAEVRGAKDYRGHETREGNDRPRKENQRAEPTQTRTGRTGGGRILSFSGHDPFLRAREAAFAHVPRGSPTFCATSRQDSPAAFQRRTAASFSGVTRTGRPGGFPDLV